MLHFATLALLMVLTGSGPSEVLASESSGQLSYEAAYRKAQDERKLLVVLVGADWCPACKTLKADTIGPMKQAGEFDEVVYTQLDKDAQPELANQVMQGKACRNWWFFAKANPAGSDSLSPECRASVG